MLTTHLPVYSCLQEDGGASWRWRHSGRLKVLEEEVIIFLWWLPDWCFMLTLKPCMTTQGFSLTWLIRPYLRLRRALSLIYQASGLKHRVSLLLLPISCMYCSHASNIYCFPLIAGHRAWFERLGEFLHWGWLTDTVPAAGLNCRTHLYVVARPGISGPLYFAKWVFFLQITLCASLYIQRPVCTLLHDQNRLIGDKLSAWKTRAVNRNGHLHKF